MEKDSREHRPEEAPGSPVSDRQVPFEAGPALYQSLVEACPDAIVVADREGLIRFWNAGAEATFGHTAAETMGKSLDIIIPENLRTRHWTGYDAVMASGVTRYGTELLKVPALHRSGHRLSIEFRVALLRNNRGAIIGIAAFLRDVTAAWKEQQELRRRLVALERRDPV
jgi:PAS domain S-box-containing protein